MKKNVNNYLRQDTKEMMSGNNVVSADKFRKIAGDVTDVTLAEGVLRAELMPEELVRYQTARMIAAFGSLVREARREKGLSQLELAKIANISRSAIAEIESGSIPGGPRLGTVDRLLRACGKQLWPLARDAEINVDKSGTVRCIAEVMTDADTNTELSPCPIVPFIDVGGNKSRVPDASRPSDGKTGSSRSRIGRHKGPSSGVV